MYEELVKRLKETTVNHDDKCESCPYEEDYPCCVDCIDEMHIEAANAIEELEKFYQIMADAYETEVTKERWIPVTERLPEEYDRYYLVCLNNWNTDFCLYTKEKGFGMYITPKWWDANDEVTHWMPLPSAPEPQKEET